MTIYTGAVDPGNTGGLVLLSQEGTNPPFVVELKSMPTLKVDKLKKGKVTHLLRIDAVAVKTIFAHWQQEFGLQQVFLEEQRSNYSLKQNTDGSERKQGAGSTGTTMEQYGLLKGLLYGLGMEPIEVSAPSWQKVYANLCLQPYSRSLAELKLADASKLRSLALAKYLFPNESLLRTPRCSKPSDGLSDALLIAYHQYWAAMNPLPLKTAKPKRVKSSKLETLGNLAA